MDQRRIRNAPFIELTDAFRHSLFVDYRRIVAVRPPVYDSERSSGSVIVVDGIQSPWNMDDTMEDILEIMEAATQAAPRTQPPLQTSFIPFEFEDGSVVYVDYQRIVAFKNVSGGSLVYIDGFNSVDEDGTLKFSIAPPGRARDILTAIREAERRLTEAA